MTVLDRVRLERAVLAYDFWLDLRGARRRRRRDLRAELRANLREASARSGSKSAVSTLGSIRLMAAEATVADPSRPRWTAGLQAGLAALLGTALVAFFAGLAWADGVLDAAPEQPVRGSVTFLPGSSMEYAPVTDGFSVSTGVGWLPPAIGALVFFLVARPWRALTGHRVPA